MSTGVDGSHLKRQDFNLDKLGVEKVSLLPLLLLTVKAVGVRPTFPTRAHWPMWLSEEDAYFAGSILKKSIPAASGDTSTLPTTLPATRSMTSTVPGSDPIPSTVTNA